jgi:aminocarboxymuconate-semialdehyde decarboxylase
MMLSSPCCSGLYSRRHALRVLALAGGGALSRPVLGAAQRRVVDVHSHFWPLEYLDRLRASSDIDISTGDDGNARIHYPGNTTVIVRGHHDLDYREQVLDVHGVATQVLSFSNPGTHVQPPAQAISGSKLINDAFAAVVAERGKRFRALATLPLNDPHASAMELERAVRELQFPGAMILSNVSGAPLSDSRFLPLYEKANDLGAVLYVHPTYPAATEGMTEYRLTALIGFPTDTSVAAARLVYSGIVERFPRIRWILANLGGTIPFLAERLDRGYYAFEECRANIAKPPSEFLQDFYYDTVNFDPRALAMTAEFAGFDRLLAGSDYPQRIGSLEKMLTSIDALNTAAHVDAIRSGNAARLMALE